MFLALDGDPRRDPCALAEVDMVLAEIAVVSRDFFGLAQPLGKHLPAFKHRRHRLLIVGGLGHLRHHDQHRLGLDDGLGVIVPLEAPAHDVQDARFSICGGWRWREAWSRPG